MGWSCTSKAGNRLESIENWCYWHGVNGGEGPQDRRTTNGWVDIRTGEHWFFQVGPENDDGAITGAVYRYRNDLMVYVRSGSFRIEPDGRMTRGPKAMKSVPYYEVSIDGKAPEVWLPLEHGTPDARNLAEYAMSYAASLKIGGVNAHISKSLGYVPYPSRAKIINVETGETVAEWKAALFQVW